MSVRTHTQEQENRLLAKETKPIRLVVWEHSGIEELISCSGDVEYDSQNYTSASVDITRLSDGRTATLTMPATSTRITETRTKAWRRGVCKIYAIIAEPNDSNIYTTSDAILELDGYIRQSRYAGGKITVSASQISLDGNFTPRNRAEEFANHIPAPNTLLEWEGDKIVLVPR